MSARLIVEGGGNTRDSRSVCREGFSEMLRKAGFAGRMPSIFAGGSRSGAYDAFCTAMRDAAVRGTPFLLVDSEGPVQHPSPWEHVRDRPGDQWVRPDGASDEQLHLMVQCMESWFLADRQAVADFFGKGFRASALPGNTNVEQVDRKQLVDDLDRAAKDTAKKRYEKGRDSFDLLARIDPVKVADASAWAKRFFDTLRAQLR